MNTSKTKAIIGTKRTQLIKTLIAKIRKNDVKKPKMLNRIGGFFPKMIWSASLLLSSNFCFAAQTDNYQFTQALAGIMNELKGAPIMIITVIGIIAAGFYWIFKGHDVGMKQVVSALVGGGLVLAAPTLVGMVPGMNGAMI